MPIIIAYTYKSSYICPYCAFERLKLGHIERRECTDSLGNYDEHNMPTYACEADSGEFVNPVFSTDEQLGRMSCDDCSDRIDCL